MGIFLGRRETRAEFGDSSIPPNSSLSTFVSGAGVIVSPDGALRIATGMSCVQAVSEDLAMLPMFAYTDSGDATRKISPQPRIVQAPFGDDVSPQTGFGQIMVSLLLRGNAYCQVSSRDFYGFPTSLIVLNPDQVRVTRDPKTNAKQYRINSQLVANPDDIKHIPGLSLPGSDIGVSVVEYQRNTLGLALAVDEFGATWFGKGVHPSGILAVQQGLTPERSKELQDRITTKHAGMARAHGIMVVSGGATYTPLSISPEDAQFLATKQLLREDICGLFGVHPDRVGIGAGKTPAAGKGIETIGQQYLTHTLLRWARRVEWTWTAMIPTGKTRTKFDFGELLRADSSTRWANYLIARTIGAMNNDEIRGDEDMPPIGGDTGTAYDFPLNSAHATAGDAGPGGGINQTPDATEGS